MDPVGEVPLEYTQTMTFNNLEVMDPTNVKASNDFVQSQDSVHSALEIKLPYAAIGNTLSPVKDFREEEEAQSPDKLLHRLPNNYFI